MCISNECLASTDYCSYAEYQGETLPYSDLKLPGLGINQVKHYLRTLRNYNVR